MKRAVTLLLMLTCSAVGFGQARVWTQEPTAFRSVPFGSSEKDAKQILKTDFCFDFEGNRVCSVPFELAGVALTSIMSFREDKLVYVFGNFASTDYEVVRSVFIDKYGTPMKRSQSALQTRIGVKYEQEELEWDGPKIHLKLRRYGDTVTEGSFGFDTKAWLAVMAKEAEAKRAKAKDGL